MVDMKKIGTILIIAFLLGGCSSFLEEYSQDLARVESYTDLDEVLLGEGYLPFSYVSMSGTFPTVTKNYFQSIHYMSDELTKFLSSKEASMTLGDNMFGWHAWQQDVGLTFDGTSRVAEDEDWSKAYQCINTCNSVLLDIEQYEGANEKEQLDIIRIKGETAFLRGLYYFTLVNLYGQPYCKENLSSPAVPIKLTAMVEDKDYTCATVSEVYDQVLKDLNLAESYLSQTSVKNYPFRADITAVYLLKSRVYLYMQDWKNALAYAQKTLERNGNLLDLNSFDLSANDVLTETSPEIIFSMGGHVLANFIYNVREFESDSWKALPSYTISNDLVEAFTEGENDWRIQYYICKDTIGRKSDYYDVPNVPYREAWVFRKVRGWDFGDKKISDNFLFRTAEAYLNGAEAAAMSGDESTAKTLLKTLRDNRLKNSAAISESGQDLIALIRQERQCELCLEGHRWFDLRRYMVNEQYPYSKQIVHHYCDFDSNKNPVNMRSYTLEENDPAYTLALPKEVLDFQNSLGVNKRPIRKGETYTPEPPVEITPPGEGTGSTAYDAGYDAGYSGWIIGYTLEEVLAAADNFYEPYSSDWYEYTEGVYAGWAAAEDVFGEWM